MTLKELLNALTDDYRKDPRVILKAKYQTLCDGNLYFTYKGCVLWASELFDDLPQEILDRKVLSTKKEKNQFGLDNYGSIVAIDYTIEIPF